MTTTRTLPVLAGLLLLSAPLAAQPKDAAGCADDPLFPTRMPGYRIERCETKPFGAYEFFTAKGPRQAVEGEFTFNTYTVDRREDDRSGLEVVRNYEAALTRIGGKVRASDPQRWLNGTVAVDGREVWVQVEKGNGKIWLRLVRPRAMSQVIVADAAALGNDLRASGHVAVAGIHFDTGKAELRADSAQAVGEIARLLQGDAALRVFVVGHTDTVGGVESNLQLSRDRAAAVVRALTRDHGIAADRLVSFGSGPFAPVASNDSEDGRARNRRVELVKQ